jgi:hypothetical protein
MKITYDGESFLLASDVRGTTKERLVSKYGDEGLTSDVSVLQVSHHGVESALNREGELPLLREATADGDVEGVVISNNNDPTKGDDGRHTASKPVLCAIDEYRVDTYWTGRSTDGDGVHGTIEYTVTEEGMDHVKTYDADDPKTDAGELGTQEFDDFDCRNVDALSGGPRPNHPEQGPAPSPGPDGRWTPPLAAATAEG